MSDAQQPEQDTPQPTPWGQMIRDAREAANLSIPEAARQAGVSPGQWGNIERGYQTIGKKRQLRAPGAARTVAHMAGVVGITPERLATAGRQDAARILAEIIEHTRVVAEAPASNMDPSLRRIWEDKELTHAERLGILALVEGMRSANREGTGSLYSAGTVVGHGPQAVAAWRLPVVELVKLVRDRPAS